jgi:hypothetical protein
VFVLSTGRGRRNSCTSKKKHRAQPRRSLEFDVCDYNLFFLKNKRQKEEAVELGVNIFLDVT